MKQNKMMRLASGLLVACLLTSSIVSGTFAKYVTTSSGGDTARVAKWGIKMTNTGSSLFSDTYEASVATSETNKNVVAPGTNGSSTYVIKGQPETDYVISFDYADLKDVYLGEGEYKYSTEDGIGYNDMTRTLDSNTKYYPVNYSITIVSEKGELKGTITEKNTAKTYETLEAAMNALKGTTISYDENEECALTVTLAWEWEFDKADGKDPIIPVTGHDSNDAYDTILGDLAAGNEDLKTTAVKDTNYSIDINYTLTMTATQVD